MCASCAVSSSAVAYTRLPFDHDHSAGLHFFVQSKPLFSATSGTISRIVEFKSTDINKYSPLRRSECYQGIYGLVSIADCFSRIKPVMVATLSNHRISLSAMLAVRLSLPVSRGLRAMWVAELAIL